MILCLKRKCLYAELQTNFFPETGVGNMKGEDGWEGEVDDLVAWTQALDDDLI